jgi:hypothetical protein
MTIAYHYALHEPWPNPDDYITLQGTASFTTTMSSRWAFDILSEPRPDRSDYPQHWHWLIGRRP